MGSTRFPGKPLANILGKPMIERVWHIATAVPSASRVVVATDDIHLKNKVEGFGGEAQLTSSDCKTGTDRVAEAARLMGYTDGIFINLQGDAPLTPPSLIEEMIQVMVQDPLVPMATAACLADGMQGTKVVFDKKNNALYFSKAEIPHHRNSDEKKIYRHIGLYAYRFATLQKLSSLEESPLEKAEKLEQLRALENGISIKVVTFDLSGKKQASVDYLEDIAIVEEILLQEKFPPMGLFRSSICR